MRHHHPLGARLHHRREGKQGPVQHPGAAAVGRVDAGKESRHQHLVVLLLQLWGPGRDRTTGGGWEQTVYGGLTSIVGQEEQSLFEEEEPTF